MLPLPQCSTRTYSTIVLNIRKIVISHLLSVFLNHHYKNSCNLWKWLVTMAKIKCITNCLTKSKRKIITFAKVIIVHSPLHFSILNQLECNIILFIFYIFLHQYFISILKIKLKQVFTINICFIFFYYISVKLMFFCDQYDVKCKVL